MCQFVADYDLKLF